MRTFHPIAWLVLALVGFPASVWGQNLVDLKLDSTPRKYTPDNGVSSVGQKFSLSSPGLLTMVYVGDPVIKDAHGGYTLDEANLSNFDIGPTTFQERVPKTAIPGQKMKFTQTWACGPRKAPLNLKVSLAAPHQYQAFQIRNAGEQFAASQRLTFDWVPYDKISSKDGPAAEFDITGKWHHGDARPATWTFTPKGDGTYDAVEAGADNAKGIARVKGRGIYIDWSIVKDGKTQKGVSWVEVNADGKNAGGWSIGEPGVGGEKWFTTTPVKTIPNAGGVAGTTPGTAGTTPGGTGTTPTTPGGTGSATSPIPGGSEPANVTKFTVQAGVRKAKPGEVVMVPVYLLSPGGVSNVNAAVSFAAAGATVEGKIARGNVLGSALFEANPGETGVVRIGFAGTKGIADSGTIAQIPFKATGKPGDRIALKVSVTTANAADGKSLTADTIDGAVVIVGEDGFVPGDADGDGVLTAGDALSALKMSVKLIPEKLSVDLDKDGKVTSNDARLILAKVVGK